MLSFLRTLFTPAFLFPFVICVAIFCVLNAKATTSGPSQTGGFALLIFCTGVIMFAAMMTSAIKRTPQIKVICRTVFYTMFFGCIVSLFYVMQTHAKVEAKVVEIYDELVLDGPPFPESKTFERNYRHKVRLDYALFYTPSEDRQSFSLTTNPSSGPRYVFPVPKP